MFSKLQPVGTSRKQLLVIANVLKEISAVLMYHQSNDKNVETEFLI